MGRPPSTIGGMDRRRSNTDVMRRDACANGWLVDAAVRAKLPHDLSRKKGRDLRVRLDAQARSHGSITWSARCSSVCGIVRPNALAVYALDPPEDPGRPHHDHAGHRPERAYRPLRHVHGRGRGAREVGESWRFRGISRFASKGPPSPPIEARRRPGVAGAPLDVGVRPQIAENPLPGPSTPRPRASVIQPNSLRICWL
jgi:hypothetical protein